MNGYDILENLKMQVSKLEYMQYVSKIQYDAQNSQENLFIFLTDNIFLANWAKRKYRNLMIKFVEQTTNFKPEILFNLKSERQPPQIPQRKYIIKNNQYTINQDYTFEKFIVGECNEFAYKMTKEAAKRQKPNWNPLLIYGNTGLGKTHLLNAVCHSVYKRNPNAMIIYITAEIMFNEYRHRLQNKTMDQFRERFRKCDYLLIDDVQFLANTEKFQEEFFNTFNDINLAGGQIIMTSDKPPKLIEKLEKRLKSRFDGGMSAKIESPELETKIHIIKQKCELNNINLDSKIIDLLATQVHDNIREIEGIILKLHGQMSLLNMPITTEIVENELKDRGVEKKHIDFEDVITLVARELNLKPTEIRNKTRSKKTIAKARKIVAYIAREETNTTFPAIASELNLKDHSAVSKQIKTLKEEMQQNPQLKNEISNMISKLKHILQ
ncbi:chromosomal replication initiator protein DnaA [Helicobacter sp. MIT 14-3879]|uniref:chromosomal replication initiator protein DnaA n=1 Tax=Helicobacter sp. MIT 14-3879 TaxID=2040649 RepID=UPI000E1EAE95|nr:chromosomal replication initiator protein DnaA [Helicobacter sp. MIT 14-3879]RDU61566.1 chromosomal replication initiator protein DnaA [Helicobacter sp. MIT 14-3879]